MVDREQSVYTIDGRYRVRLTVKGSRFIGSLAPADTEEEAQDFIGSIQAEFPDATHNTYAYRVGYGCRRIERSSDAREPAGTAGPPMLQALAGAGVTNAVMVATRYFGGVKLGIGGLIRAYRSCARACLEEARLVKIRELDYFKIYLSYEDLGPAIRHIESCAGEIVDINYAQRVTVTFAVPLSQKQEAVAGLDEISRGQVQIKNLPQPGGR